MVDPSTIQELVGAFLAQGFSHNEIVNNLCTQVPEMSPGEALSAIKRVYNVWKQSVEELDLNSEDHRNWHVQQRHRLLRESLAEGTVLSQRLALSTLDSLAAMQGLKTTVEHEFTKPLTLTLVPKEESPE